MPSIHELKAPNPAGVTLWHAGINGHPVHGSNRFPAEPYSRLQMALASLVLSWNMVFPSQGRIVGRAPRRVLVVERFEVQLQISDPAAK